MGKRHNYKQLEIYKRSLKLAVEILKMVDEIRSFRLAEQITGASISIPSNISEGSERGTDKEFRRFLEFSSGSASELLTQLTIVHLSEKYRHFPIEHMIQEADEINAMIRGFINRLSRD